MMKVGDLVNFNTKAWVFKHAEKRYANPGLVLHIDASNDNGKLVAEVYWRDGKVTREYDSYLQPTEVIEDANMCK